MGVGPVLLTLRMHHAPPNPFLFLKLLACIVKPVSLASPNFLYTSDIMCPAFQAQFRALSSVQVLFCVWLSDALSSKRVTKLYSEPIQTVLPTNPNRTRKQSKPYSICAQTRYVSFLDRGPHKTISLKIVMFRFSNHTRNRARTAADILLRLRPHMA